VELAEVLENGGFLGSVKDLEEAGRDLGVGEADTSVHVGEERDSTVESDETSEEEGGGIELGSS
jgi:hypothetical protein